MLNAVRSAVGSEQSKERDELTEQQKVELEKVKIEPFLEFHQWQQERAEVDRMEIVRVEQEREREEERGYGMSM